MTAAWVAAPTHDGYRLSKYHTQRFFFFFFNESLHLTAEVFRFSFFK